VNKRTPPSKKDAKRKHRIEMTSWTIFAWLCCLFLLMSWIFVLGIFVGRGFIPESVTAIADLRNQLNKLQERVFRGQKPDQEARKEQDYDSKLAFYNELSNKKEEKKKNLPEASPRESVGKVKTEVTKALPEASRKQSVENDAQKRPMPPDKNGYTVQLASLGEEGKARATVERLKKGGYDAYYEKVQVRGKTWYRVRCGKFSTRDEAENHAKRLAGETRLKGLVMKLE
jgi:cell division septation protein DedD